MRLCGEIAKRRCAIQALRHADRGACGRRMSTRKIDIDFPTLFSMRNAMSIEDWRSPSPYVYTRNLNSRGLAWELLRRDPDYRADHERTVSEPDPESASAASARRWGLRFRGRSRVPGD
jgi:hypothetical protein